MAAKFEDALGRLEELVQVLERGDLSLEESLKAFEEGVKLSKNCLKLLDDAEKRVEILLGGQGRKRLQPFDVADEGPAAARSTPQTDTEPGDG
jgi:exodeoxyribonuclease VII small subunit